MYIRVNAVASAKKELVKQLASDRYEIRVKEPAERNLANGRIRALVAAEIGVAEKSVRLISGHTSPHKIFSVTLPPLEA